MTVDELKHKLNTEFGMSGYPKTYTVDKETFMNVLLHIWEYKAGEMRNIINKDYELFLVTLSMGRRGGVFFKNVELIMEE